MKTLEFKDANAIRNKITLQGDTLTSFANAIDDDLSMLSTYLSGKRRPNPTTAKKIAMGLGVEINDIFSA